MSVVCDGRKELPEGVSREYSSYCGNYTSLATSINAARLSPSLNLTLRTSRALSPAAVDVIIDRNISQRRSLLARKIRPIEPRIARRRVDLHIIHHIRETDAAQLNRNARLGDPAVLNCDLSRLGADAGALGLNTLNLFYNLRFLD